MTALTTRELRALAILFILTLPAVTTRLYSSDEVQYYSYLRSLWFDRDVSFENEYRYFYDHGVARTPGFAETFLEPLTPTGRRESFATVGCALLWAPFYAIADAATRITRPEGQAADGYSHPYVAAVAYASAFYGFAALLLSIAAARRMTGGGIAAALAVWFGTPLLFYMYAAPPFSHACSAFAVALFVTVWLRVRERWSVGGTVCLGAAAALMTMVREQDAFYAGAPAVDFISSALRGSGLGTAGSALGAGGWGLGARGVRASRAAAAGVAAFALLYAPQLAAYWSLNGRFGPSQLVTRKMNWTAPHAPGVLASPEHGWFAWTPLALLSLAGLIVLAVRRDWPARPDGTAPPLDRRPVAAGMLLMLALQVYISGSVESWTVAGAFGQRRFVSATILLVVGLAALLRVARPPGPRWLAGVAIAVAIWWNIGLTALFGANLMDRQRLQVRQNAYDVFVTLPRDGPGLAYRYFTQRESFYQKPK
jgi:hypothetical protein